LIAVLVAFLGTLRVGLRSRLELEAEILALRHQLALLQRAAPRRLRLHRTDRLFWVLLSRCWPNWRHAVQIVQPATVLRWHRRAFAVYWGWQSRSRPQGRPSAPPELCALIRQMHQANPLWGAPRIHGELRKLGLDVSQTTVAKYLPRRTRPPSPTWGSFLRTHASQLATLDFFTVPTATFRVLFVLVVLAHNRRRILYVNVTAHPTSTWTRQQLREAFPWDRAPRLLLRDRDAIFDAAFSATVESMGMEEVTTAPRSPWQNPFVERVIGSIRRECLDHVIVWNERGLRRLLRAYLAYYHAWRTHLALEKDAPEPRAIAAPGRGDIIVVPHLGGLHHHYERRAA
jgi:putative transposase